MGCYRWAAPLSFACCAWLTRRQHLWARTHPTNSPPHAALGTLNGTAFTCNVAFLIDCTPGNVRAARSELATLNWTVRASYTAGVNTLETRCARLAAGRGHPQRGMRCAASPENPAQPGSAPPREPAQHTPAQESGGWAGVQGVGGGSEAERTLCLHAAVRRVCDTYCPVSWRQQMTLFATRCSGRSKYAADVPHV